MDTTQYGESIYLTPTLVKESQQPVPKMGIIVSDVTVEDGSFGKQLSVQVSFDKKVKTWKMNKESVKNMRTISALSENWLTKKVAFSVVPTSNGKEKVVGTPFLDQGQLAQ